MEYTELADYPLPFGTVTEWIPTSAEDDWAPDPRELSTNHVAHLRCSSPGAADQGCGSWIGTAFRVDARLDYVTFGIALRQWIDRHEAYRTTPVAPTPSAPAEYGRATLAPDRVRLDVRRYGRSRTGNEIYRQIERFFASEITAHRWPHLAVATIEPDDGDGFLVLVGADHSVMDAFTQLLLIAEIRALYVAALAGEEASLPPCGSYVDHSAADHVAARALGPDHAAVAAWRAFWHNDTGEFRAAAFPLPVRGPRPTGSTQSSLSRWLLTADETQAFAEVCKRHGTSLSTGAHTALALALGRLSGSPTVRYVMPMHTRTAPEWYGAAGWFVSLIPVRIDLGDAPSFVDALPTVNRDVRRDQDLARHSYPRVTELLGIVNAPEFVVSFVDVRHLPGAESWTPDDRALRSRIADESEVYLWINRTRDGMNISLRFPNNETAAASVHAMLAELSAVMRAVADGTAVGAGVEMSVVSGEPAGGHASAPAGHDGAGR